MNQFIEDVEVPIAIYFFRACLFCVANELHVKYISLFIIFTSLYMCIG